jgi:hypothetical protein
MIECQPVVELANYSKKGEKIGWISGMAKCGNLRVIRHAVQNKA